jgi:hypothetical protein
MAMQLLIRETSIKVWRDTFRVLRAYPLIWIVSLLLSSMITTMAGSEAVKAITENAAWFSAGWLLEAFLMLVPLLFLIPAALLTHRFVVLNSHENLVQVLSPLRRVRLYAALEAASVALLMMLLGLISAAAAIDGDAIATVAMLGVTSAGVAVVWLMFCLAAVYPAIAMDADLSEIAAAFHATRGRTWSIAAIAILTSAPIVLAGIMLYIFGPSDESQRLLLPWRVLSDLLIAASTLLWVVVMSNVYLGLIKNDNRTDPQI